MDMLTVILIVLILGLMAVVMMLVMKGQKSQPAQDQEAMGALKGQLDQIALMAGNLQQHVTTQLQNQERNLTENLRKQAETTGQKLGDLL